MDFEKELDERGSIWWYIYYRLVLIRFISG